MKTAHALSLSISALLLLISQFGCSTTKTSPSEEIGFTSLFNEKNFEGWYLKLKNDDTTLAKQVFTINDQGWVHVFGDHFKDGYNLDSGKYDTHGMMYTEQSYSRYILKFEYKWGNKRTNNFGTYQYDAGVYYHVYNDGIWPGGMEYQIRYNHLNNTNHTGDYWMSGKSRMDWSATHAKGTYLPTEEGGQLQERRSGEHRCRADATYHALNGEWNSCEVIVMGNQYAIHKLNGQIVNLGTNLNLSEGKIGFQSETAELYYRNIRIKEFQDDLPIEHFLK